MSLLKYGQCLGQAIMLPVAILPVAAILLRLGQPDMFGIVVMANAGRAIFTHLPLFFAIGIAVGLTKKHSGAAGFAGAIGYLILENVSHSINPSVDMSFFGGIVVGMTAGHLYNYFHHVSLSGYWSSFSGIRLVSIVTGMVTLILGVLCGYIWPLFQQGIDNFGHLISQSGLWGSFIYGFLNRLLVPIGLHHILNSVFWFGLGDCVSMTYTLGGQIQTVCMAPEIVQTLHVGGTVPSISESIITHISTTIMHGDINRFFAGDPNAGMFMTGFFPVMMFGMPGIALAMYCTSESEERRKISGLLLSVSLTAFLTGVTEPVEFLFMFMCPQLYLCHCVLTGLSFVVTNMLDIRAGFGFSAGLFDFLINWKLSTYPIRLVFVGLVVGIIYFSTFYLGLKVFRVKIFGKKQKNEDTERATVSKHYCH